MPIVWQGQAQVKAAMRQYGEDVRGAVGLLAQRWSVDIENHAKENAPWQDRTANARQSLYTVVDEQRDRVTIYLSHGVDYGIYLELRYQGQYAIIERTLEYFYKDIQDSVKRMLS